MSNENQYDETLLISEDMLKLYSPLSKDISVDKVYPYCLLAQNFYLLPILGKPLTQELQYQVEMGTLTEDNKALLVKIAPCLSFYTTYLSMRALSYSIVEKGITKYSSENSESIGEKELGEFILDVKNKSEMYEDVLIDYLCECADLYPLWRPTNECQCGKRVKGSGRASRDFHNLIYFPKRGKDKCDCN